MNISSLAPETVDKFGVVPSHVEDLFFHAGNDPREGPGQVPYLVQSAVVWNDMKRRDFDSV